MARPIQSKQLNADVAVSQPTVAALEALPGPQATAPQVTWIQEFEAFYVFVPGSVAVVDHYTVLGVTGGVAGRWILQSSSIHVLPVAGGGDNSPRIQALVSALGGSGVELWFGPGTFVLLTQINLPSFLVIRGTPDTIIHQTLLGAGNVSAFSASGVYGSPIAITAQNVPGSKIVQSAAAPANGTRVYVADGFDGCGYTVISSVAAGPNWNLTLDRPVNASLSVAGFVTPLTSYPQEIFIYGNGMKFTGTSAGAVAGYIGFGNAYRCFVFDCIADGSLGSIGTTPAVAFNFDLGSVECEFIRCRADGANLCQQLFAFQSSERGRAVECTAQNAAQNGFVFLDCWDCEVVNSDGYDCGGAGVAWSSNNGGSVVGSNDCRLINGTFNGNAYGAILAYGSSNNRIVGSTFGWTTNYGVWVDVNTGPLIGNVLEAVTIYGAGLRGLEVSGNGIELRAVGLTVNNTQGPAVEVTGTGCVVVLEAFTSYDGSIAGGNTAISFQGVGSQLFIKGGYIATKATTVAALWTGIFPGPGTFVSLDDVVFAKVAGSAASPTIAVQAQSISVLYLRDVRTVGAIDFGLGANAGATAVNVRLYNGCDFSSCGTPYLIDASAEVNRGKFTATGLGTVTVGFTNMRGGSADAADAGDRVLLTLVGGTVGVGIAPGQLVRTANTGFTYTGSAASDLGVYEYVIE